MESYNVNQHDWWKELSMVIYANLRSAEGRYFI